MIQPDLSVTGTVAVIAELTAKVALEVQLYSGELLGRAGLVDAR